MILTQQYSIISSWGLYSQYKKKKKCEQSHIIVYSKQCFIQILIEMLRTVTIFHMEHSLEGSFYNVMDYSIHIILSRR